MQDRMDEKPASTLYLVVAILVTLFALALMVVGTCGLVGSVVYWVAPIFGYVFTWADSFKIGSMIVAISGIVSKLRKS